MNRFDPDGQGTELPAPCGLRQIAEERKGARAMTQKERVRVHVQIERENKRKLKEWKEERRKERKSA